jgi:hypothetical protein
MLGEIFMIYKEFKDPYGFLSKEWRNNAGELHREDGPAEICYNANGSIRHQAFYLNGSISRKDGPAYIYHKLDGSIDHEAFYVSGKFLEIDKVGFWRLWEILNEVERQAPDILKCLARYS